MNSMWYGIALAVGVQMRAAAEAQAAGYLDNPALPIDLGSQGERVLFVIHRGDRLIDKPGQAREKRVFRVLVGVLALTRTALADADTLHFAARQGMRSDALRTALRALGDVSRINEVEIEPELKDIAAEGLALMSAFEIEYFQTYEAAA